ncbi:MAG TPA: uroporphyrinogen decarboxylase family protein [Aggregatilineaceae bacterium]|nr:uroporphyrinogen decarboxylase family protein [Aggregatilineaceae bacterium]
MNSRDRLLAALNHQEPDRIPFDLGSTQVTGIHTLPYQSLREVLGLPSAPVALCDSIQQLATPDDDLLQHWGVDTRGLYPLNSHNWHVVEIDAGDYWEYHDEWGIAHRRPRPDGLYYSIWKTPLSGPEISADVITRLPWPNLADPQRIAGLHAQAVQYRAQGYAVVIKDPFAGIFEMAQRIVGMQELLMIMATDDELAGVLFDKLLELKLGFWEMALPQLGDLVDVVTYADDYGTQQSQLISPAMFRRQLKPRIKILFERIKQLAPHIRQFFHSCGNVRPLIPDYIEIGTDILNPVHIRAAGMDPAALKRDFGKDIIFWGGGVDTQEVLPHRTPREVKEDVCRNIEALAPGGGYVFSTVHNIQPDVPPQNAIALWEALQEYGIYRS